MPRPANCPCACAVLPWRHGPLGPAHHRRSDRWARGEGYGRSGPIGKAGHRHRRWIPVERAAPGGRKLGGASGIGCAAAARAWDFERQVMESAAPGCNASERLPSVLKSLPGNGVQLPTDPKPWRPSAQDVREIDGHPCLQQRLRQTLAGQSPVNWPPQHLGRFNLYSFGGPRLHSHRSFCC